MTKCVDPNFADYRVPAEIIGHTVWLCVGFLLSLRMVDELFAASGEIGNDRVVRIGRIECDRGAGGDAAIRTGVAEMSAGKGWHIPDNFELRDLGQCGQRCRGECQDRGHSAHLSPLNKHVDAV